MLFVIICGLIVAAGAWGVIWSNTSERKAGNRAIPLWVYVLVALGFWIGVAMLLAI